MDTTKIYHIYKAHQEGIQLNDTHANNKNPIFRTIYNYYKQKQKNTKHIPPSNYHQLVHN
jgi:hypothetical protein